MKRFFESQTALAIVVGMLLMTCFVIQLRNEREENRVRIAEEKAALWAPFGRDAFYFSKTWSPEMPVISDTKYGWKVEAVIPKFTTVFDADDNVITVPYDCRDHGTCVPTA